jgi:flagellar biosynthesis protein FlhA
MVLGLGTGALAITASQNQKEEKSLELAAPDKSPEGLPAPGSTEEVKSLLSIDLLELEVGYELVPMVDASSGGDLIERIRALRRQFALELGFIVPPIHIRDNVRLEPSQYRLMLKGVEIASGNIKAHHHLAMDPGGIDAKIPGIPTKEPAFGLDALWISENDRERAQFAGYTVVDPPTVITTHLTEVIKSHAHEIVGREEVQALLDNLSRTHPKLVEEVSPAIVTLSIVQQVLAGLLRENVSIRDLRTILETLADWGPSTKSPERLIELCRSALSRAITAAHCAEDGTLSLISMTPSLERTLTDALQVTEHGSYLALEPTIAQRFITKLKGAAEQSAQRGAQPVLLAPGTLRPAIFAFTERFIPGFSVLSHQEITPTIKVQSLGVVGIDN